MPVLLPHSFLRVAVFVRGFRLVVTVRFFVLMAGFRLRLLLVRMMAARFVPAGFIAARLVPARTAVGRRQGLMTRRLDAAQRAAEFVNLAFIGQLLALGKFHEFQDFVQLINRVLERFGDLGGVQDGLMDGRNIGGTEISGFDPRFGAGGFGTAFGAILTFGTVLALLPFWPLLSLLSLGAVRTFRTLLRT